MRQYYYTVAALPVVYLEQTPFFTIDSFLDHCSSFMSPRDILYLRSAGVDDNDAIEVPGDSLLARWTQFTQTLAIQGATLRAQTLGWDVDLPEIAIDPVIGERVRAILAEDTPLKTETALLRIQWTFLDELAVGRYFDREAITVYFLKLQLSLRYQRLVDAEAGREEFDRQYGELSKVLMEIDT